MSKNYLRNLNRNTNSIQKYKDQLSSFKEVNRPSDDPMAVSKIMDFKQSISQNEEYLTTIEDSIDWTNVQDSALANATNSIQRIRQLVQSAATDTMSFEDRQAVKAEVKGEMHTLMDSLNTNFGGRYVFAGSHTKTTPFVINEREIEYKGTEGRENANLQREISPGVDVELLTDGAYFMGEEGDTDDLANFFTNVFEALEALDDGNTDKLSQLIGDADAITDKIVNRRTEIGAIFNRLEAAKNRNESENINLHSTLSKEQDIDVAEKIMQYSMEMVSYEASLQMGTRILQTNILNYL